MGVRALQSVLGVEPCEETVRVGRTCDKGSVQKRFQVYMSETYENSKRCHFQDILHRLPEQGRLWIEAATPNKNASKTERLEAFADISRWVIAKCIPTCNIPISCKHMELFCCATVVAKSD